MITAYQLAALKRVALSSACVSSLFAINKTLFASVTRSNLFWPLRKKSHLVAWDHNVLNNIPGVKITSGVLFQMYGFLQECFWGSGMASDSEDKAEQFG